MKYRTMELGDSPMTKKIVASRVPPNKFAYIKECCYEINKSGYIENTCTKEN